MIIYETDKYGSTPQEPFKDIRELEDCVRGCGFDATFTVRADGTVIDQDGDKIGVEK